MIDATQVFDGTFASGTSKPTGAAITVTRVSTNVIDLGAARDIGAGDEVEIHVQILTAFTAGGAATLQISLQSCATSGGTYVDLLFSPVYAVANLTVGAPIFRYKLPPMQLNDTGTPNQFLALNYVVATGPMTAGAVFAYITGMGDRQVVTNYPSNYSVV